MRLENPENGTLGHISGHLFFVPTFRPFKINLFSDIPVTMQNRLNKFVFVASRKFVNVSLIPTINLTMTKHDDVLKHCYLISGHELWNWKLA
jgi:hypothetical protein